MKVRRSGLVIMKRLAGLVMPLMPLMVLAVALGVLGYLCAIFLTILAGYGIIHTLLAAIGIDAAVTAAGVFTAMRPAMLFGTLIAMAVMRGILHYGEQYCNHFIAFKLLALIRHKVFGVLRTLAPAKLEGRDKGNLIAIITSDIELLEVFYAHTISPIAIAVVTSLVMVCFIGQYSALAGLLALCGYLAVGAVVPLLMGRKGASKGLAMRNSFGGLNSFILDSLRGLDETIQYGRGSERKRQMQEHTDGLAGVQRDLSKLEGVQRSATTFLILICSLLMLGLMLTQYRSGGVSFEAVLISVLAMMGSFGPVVALSNLSNNLNQTLASGERVLELLEEEPRVKEISGQKTVDFSGAGLDQVDFSYDQETILQNYSLSVPKDQITGIYGASGSGKSTILKLLMRFWDVNSGAALISAKNIREINTSNLREMESYVTQESYLFHDSLANNIAIGKQGAGREEIIAAAKKASIHDFITSLPKGYDTAVGELGDTLSGGERQRIGLARAFLHGGAFLLLDEPTSNLDALNEGAILKSIKAAAKNCTVVLISHRKSTMNIVDEVFEMKQGRLS